MIPTLRSLPDPTALRDRLATVYGIPFTSCTLLRSLVNDVYELTANDGRYIAKLYRTGGWEPAEIRWETGLSAHLTASGVPVPRVLPLADGTATDSFSSPFPRRPSDLAHRLDDPLAEMGPVLGSAEENLLHDLATAVRNDVVEYAHDLDRGVCHGDVSLDNALITDDGLVLYDFDLAAEGYRAADFTGVAATPQWPAFLAGYRELRTVSDADLAAIPYLTVVARIFNLRFHLVGKPLIRGTDSRSEGWAAGELTALRELAVRLTWS